jgi:hypothetical protein
MDIKDRLIQNDDPVTLLMWPPNLFAFTSYILGLSGAYHLAVSPPKNYQWPPKGDALRRFVGIIDDEEVRNAAAKSVDRAEKLQSVFILAPSPRRQALWPYLVRESGQQWNRNLADMDETAFDGYLDALYSGQIVREVIPPFLFACWTVFDQLCMRAGTPLESWDISQLLCNTSTSPDPNDSALTFDGRPTAPSLTDRWLAGIALLSMHAVADEACVGWGMQDDASGLELQFPSPADIARLHSYLSELRSPIDVASLDPKLRASIEECLRGSELRAKSVAQMWAETKRLDTVGTLAAINPYRGRVLPKRHTPDIGITLRSISSNLAFHRSAIDVAWSRGRIMNDDSRPDEAHPFQTTELGRRMTAAGGAQEDKTISILLLPFPLEVNGDYFSEAAQSEAPVEALDDYRFFKYVQNDAFVTAVKETVEAAQQEGSVDVVILPELALTEQSRLQVESCLERLDTSISFYVAGVSLDAKDDEAFPQNNAVYFKSLFRLPERDRWQRYARFPSDGALTARAGRQGIPFFQYKHHRWQLSRTQLQQYGLTRHLDETKKWWEAINIRQRRVSFVNISERLTICPLICEDLARQDPIADLIRHVGPSLVVAILMDGPQLRDRWPARYAGILSEDPGSAVLTLTSIGMVRRWSAPYRQLSNSVALWSDENGPRELELAADATGILLSVRVSSRREAVADGRLELHATSRLELKDVVQVRPRRHAF